MVCVYQYLLGDKIQDEHVGQDMWQLWGRRDVAVMGEARCVCVCVWGGGVLVMQSGRRSLLGKHGLGWEESIKTGVQGMGWETVDWIDLAPVMDKGRAFF